MARQSRGPDFSRFVTSDALGQDLSSYATKSQLNALPSYVNNGDFLTRAELKAAFPASVAYLGKLARVSDVWGSVKTSLICEFDGNTYYWRPQRTDYAIPSTQTSGKVALVPLITAPIIVMKNTLLGNVTLELSIDDVWPGCRFDITAPASLGLFSATFTGLVGSVSSLLMAGSRKQAVYTADGWRIAP